MGPRPRALDGQLRSCSVSPVWQHGLVAFLLCLQFTEDLTTQRDPLVLCLEQLAEPNGDKGEVKFF